MAKRSTSVRPQAKTESPALEERTVINPTEREPRVLARLELNVGVVDAEIISAALNIGEKRAIRTEVDGASHILVATRDVALGNGTRPRDFDFCRITPEEGVTLAEVIDTIVTYRRRCLRS